MPGAAVLLTAGSLFQQVRLPPATRAQESSPPSHTASHASHSIPLKTGKRPQLSAQCLQEMSQAVKDSLFFSSGGTALLSWAVLV